MSEPIRTIPPDWQRNDDVMVVMGATPWTRKPEIMRPIWDAGIDGSGCICINLDTGFKKHAVLPDPIAVRNFTGGNVGDVTDRHGHGNHTISSAVGRDGIGGAPKADLKVGKVLGDSGSGGNTNAGLDWAASQDGDVVSCSWGSGGPLDSSSNEACKRVEASGKWLVFAAGNAGYNGRSTVGSPALSQHTIAVSSINSDGTLSGFSSGGPRVDVAGGGGNIIGAGLNNNLVSMSGTSMATPTVAGDLLLLRQTMKKLGMKTQLTMRELVAWLKSEQFLKEAGSPGRDPMYGDGIIWTDNILGWISNKLKDLAVAMLMCLAIAGTTHAQINEAPADIPTKQIVMQRAQSVQLIEDQGKVLIISEGLEAEKAFGVILTVGFKYNWAEIHDELKPFPPRIQKPNDKGQVIVTGKPNQAFSVSLRSATEPPQWVRIVVAPSTPTDPPVDPPAGDYTKLKDLSKAKAAALDRETGLALRQSLLVKLTELESRCKAGLCPSLEQAKKEVIESINATPKNQKFDWYGGWRMPISQALLAMPLNTATYISAMRAVAAGLE